jgi:RimJ/RimL family protein N-acetyltransferase
MTCTFTLENRTAAHAEELFEVLADPALYEFLDDAPPASVEALRDRLARAETRRSPDGTEHWLNWIVRDVSGQLAGYVQSTVTAELDAHVAYVFARAFQGRGLASGAVRRMLELIAAEHEVRRFIVIAERANRRSVALAQRLGFVEMAPGVAAARRLSPTETLLYRWPVQFGPAEVSDAPAIAALINELAGAFLVHPDGRDAAPFRASVSAAAEAGYLADARYRYIVARSGAELAGFIALRDASHVFHLFVAPSYQRRGLAAGLWTLACDAAAQQRSNSAMTVNASLLAVPIYQRLGFVAQGEVCAVHGVAFQPMLRPAVASVLASTATAPEDVAAE